MFTSSVNLTLETAPPFWLGLVQLWVCIYVSDANEPFQKDHWLLSDVGVKPFFFLSFFLLPLFSSALYFFFFFRFAPTGLCSGFSLEPRGSGCPLASPQRALKNCVASDKSVAFCDRRDHRRCSTDPTQGRHFHTSENHHLMFQCFFYSTRQFKKDDRTGFVFGFCEWLHVLLRLTCHLRFTARTHLGLVNVRCFGEWGSPSGCQATIQFVDFQKKISNDDFDAVPGVGIHDSIFDSQSSGFRRRSIGRVSSTGICD